MISAKCKDMTGYDGTRWKGTGRRDKERKRLDKTKKRQDKARYRQTVDKAG